jgi:hypothetical protein
MTVKGRKRLPHPSELSVHNDLHGDTDDESGDQDKASVTMEAHKLAPNQQREILKHEERCPGGNESWEDTGEAFKRPAASGQVRDQIRAKRPHPKADLWQVDNFVGAFASPTARNGALQQKLDIWDAERFLARKHEARPALRIADGLAKYGLTLEDCEDAFQPGRPTANRQTLRAQVRAMVQELDAQGVDRTMLAKYFRCSRQAVYSLIPAQTLDL